MNTFVNAVGAEGEFRASVTVVGPTGQALSQPASQPFRVISPVWTLSLGEWTEAAGLWQRTVKVTSTFMFDVAPNRPVSLTGNIWVSEDDQTIPVGYGTSLTFDAATGQTNTAGVFTTVQRWAPVDPLDLPWDFELPVSVTLQ